MTHEEIKDLLETFAASGLTSFKYETETECLSLKKEEKINVAPVQPAPFPAPQAFYPEPATTIPSAPVSVQEKATEDVSVKEEKQDGLVNVSAPLAGVFYRAAKPGEEPYVREGQSIHKGDTLGLMEAMKLMSEVPSPVDGIVRSIEVENGEFAEYGTTLITIEESHV